MKKIFVSSMPRELLVPFDKPWPLTVVFLKAKK
jgi:hypothetical protein